MSQQNDAPARKVFISWCGDVGKASGLAVKQFVEDVVPNAQPFHSDVNMEPGQPWLHKLLTELSDTSCGIVCVTPEALNSGWIHFEAGALAKAIQSARLFTLLINVSSMYVDASTKSPLKHFQHTKVEHDPVLRMVEIINTSLGTDYAWESSRLHRQFEKEWPGFSEKLKTVASQLPHSAVQEPDEKAMLKEILSRVTAVEHRLAAKEQTEKIFDRPVRLRDDGIVEFGQSIADLLARVKEGQERLTTALPGPAKQTVN